jgi:MGT family glycosyltransferase
MKNAHVSFVGVPIGSHLNQTLPLVATFARRGYHVTYAVAEPFLARVEAAGAEPIALRLDTLTARTADELSFCRIAAHTLPRLARYYEKNPPALIAYDFTAMAARIIARRAGIPAVRLSPHFAMSRQSLAEQIPDRAFRERVLARSAGADAFLEQHGIDEPGFLFHREELNVHLFPREFEPCPAALDETCLHAGRCAGEQSGFGQWNPRNARGKPVVLVAPSTSYLQSTGYFRACIEAFSALPWHVVLSMGETPEQTSLGALPASFETVQRTSHTRILPYASAVLCMGGMATAAEAAYHGVPMIITSRGHAELEWLGDNLARAGLAAHLRGADPKAEVLRKFAIEALESTALLRNVRRLQHSVRRSAGAEETVNRLEEHIDRRSGMALRPKAAALAGEAASAVAFRRVD